MNTRWAFRQNKSRFKIQNGKISEGKSVVGSEITSCYSTVRGAKLDLRVHEEIFVDYCEVSTKVSRIRIWFCIESIIR